VSKVPAVAKLGAKNIQPFAALSQAHKLVRSLTGIADKEFPDCAKLNSEGFLLSPTEIKLQPAGKALLPEFAKLLDAKAGALLVVSKLTVVAF